jgi:glycosyltransferase involved in cell wall biosynthesis
MKIMTIVGNYYPHLGGITTVIKEVSETLVKKGHECTVLTINHDNIYSNEKRINGVYVKRINSPTSNYLFGFSPAMYRYLKKNKALIDGTDIIHVHGYHTLMSLEAIYLCQNKNKPIIFTPHYHAIGHTKLKNLLHKLYKPIGRQVFKYVDKVVCVSEYEASLIQKDFVVSSEKIQIIPNGVKQINSSIKKKREGNVISLLYVGYVRRYKGVQYILSAMEKLEKKHDKKVILNIIGTGDYENEIKKLAKNLNLEGRVFWYSNLSENELYQKYKNTDIFLLLSHAEAYGIVVAEALASGTPCIVAKTSALSEFVNEPGCFGIEYPPDPEKLASLILKIYNSDVKVGPFNQNKIRTWDEVAKEYEEVYNEALAMYRADK